MFHQFVVWLAGTVGQLGYPGIVMLMALVDGCGILVLSIGENGIDVRGIRKTDGFHDGGMDKFLIG